MTTLALLTLILALPAVWMTGLGRRARAAVANDSGLYRQEAARSHAAIAVTLLLALIWVISLALFLAGPAG